jgi:uncharacterized protein YjeT (DUF2065 family)
MDITSTVAQIYGPILLAIGFGIFVSPSYYKKAYHDIEQESLAAFTLGLLMMSVGGLLAAKHALWATPAEIVVTLLGWGTFLKGVVFLVAPSMADRGGDWAAESPWFRYLGIVMLVLGAYVSWVGFMA